MGVFDLAGALRRIRRIADLSQRELADACGVSPSVIARAESGRRALSLETLAKAAGLAHLRVTLVDAAGTEVVGMTGDAVRDRAGRLFPAHLDTRYGDDDWWHGPERYSRVQPWYTFDRRRDVRDRYRTWNGTPDDHQLPRPGDSPQERKEARRRAEWLRQQEKLDRALREGPRRPVVEAFTCECPPACEELDDHRGMPVHAPDCPCQCDVG